MSKKTSKISLSLLIILLLIINIIGFYRWQKLTDDGDIKYKKDLWTNQIWADFYSPSASGLSLEIPLINKSEFLSINEIQPHLEKHALSGQLVNEWIKRTRFTDFYVGLNISLGILVLIILLILFKKNQTPLKYEE
jgi:hypothetical protein